jgi:hypothetical protein
VIFALLAGVTQKATPLQLIAENPYADGAGLLVFTAGILWIYLRVKSKHNSEVRRSASAPLPLRRETLWEREGVTPRISLLRHH